MADQQLKATDIIGDSINFTLNNFAVFMQTLWLPFLFISLFGLSVQVNDETVVGPSLFIQSNFVLGVGFLVYVLCYLIIAVAVHRRVFFGADTSLDYMDTPTMTTVFTYGLGALVVAVIFIGSLVALFFVLLAPLAMDFFNYMASGNPLPYEPDEANAGVSALGAFLMFPGMILIFWVYLRLFFVLPFIVKEGRFSIKEPWQMSSGYAWDIFVMLFLASLVSMVVTVLFSAIAVPLSLFLGFGGAEVGWGMGTILGYIVLAVVNFVATYLLTVFSVALMSYAYAARGSGSDAELPASDFSS